MKAALRALNTFTIGAELVGGLFIAGLGVTAMFQAKADTCPVLFGYFATCAAFAVLGISLMVHGWKRGWPQGRNG